MPYKGNVPAITDLLAGQTSMAFATMPTVLPYVKAGRLKGIAVLGTGRSPAAPELPALAEALPGFEVNNWVGTFGPAGLPAANTAKLNTEILAIMLHAGRAAAVVDRRRAVYTDDAGAVRGVCCCGDGEVGEVDSGGRNSG